MYTTSPPFKSYFIRSRIPLLVTTRHVLISVSSNSLGFKSQKGETFFCRRFFRFRTPPTCLKEKKIGRCGCRGPPGGFPKLKKNEKSKNAHSQFFRFRTPPPCLKEKKIGRCGCRGPPGDFPNSKKMKKVKSKKMKMSFSISIPGSSAIASRSISILSGSFSYWPTTRDFSYALTARRVSTSESPLAGNQISVNRYLF